MSLSIQSNYQSSGSQASVANLQESFKQTNQLASADDTQTASRKLTGSTPLTSQTAVSFEQATAKPSKPYSANFGTKALADYVSSGVYKPSSLTK